MTPFLLWAALLAVGGALALGVPLLRLADVGKRPWLGGGLAVLLVTGGGAALYPLLSNYSWQHAEATARAEAGAGIPALLKATADKPTEVAAWVKLGEGYAHIHEWGPAIRTFDKANVLARGRNVAPLVGLGQALLQTGDEQRVEQAIQLFEQALTIDPQSEVALVYTAVYYMQAGKPQLARDRFAAMLATNPPEAVQAALKKQLDALDQQLVEARTAAAAAIHLEVSLAPAIAAQVPAGASLFVFVPSPGGGPPLAVKRVAGPLPQQLSLSGADAMIAGHGIKAGDAVKVVARLSKGGTPTASPGDPFGEAQARVGAPGTIKIVIDQVTPGN
jgi:cytochrome c-type biogenesis protein CcmH